MNLIGIFINNLTKEQAKVFLENNDISLTENEFNYLFYEVKNNYVKIINEEELELDNIKNNINKDSYKKLYNLFIKYKKKYLL